MPSIYSADLKNMYPHLYLERVHLLGYKFCLVVMGFTGPPADKVEFHDPLKLNSFLLMRFPCRCCCFREINAARPRVSEESTPLSQDSPDISFLSLAPATAQSSLTSLLAFNKDSMCCVAAAKDFTNAGWREVTALYISHWHWQLTDGYHSHTEKKPPGRFANITLCS